MLLAERRIHDALSLIGELEQRGAKRWRINSNSHSRRPAAATATTASEREGLSRESGRLLHLSAFVGGRGGKRGGRGACRVEFRPEKKLARRGGPRSCLLLCRLSSGVFLSLLSLFLLRSPSSLHDVDMSVADQHLHLKEKGEKREFAHNSPAPSREGSTKPGWNGVASLPEGTPCVDVCHAGYRRCDTRNYLY